MGLVGFGKHKITGLFPFILVIDRGGLEYRHRQFSGNFNNNCSWC